MSEAAEDVFLETAIQTETGEDAIRLKSYQIWQQEGCPFGDELRHWEQAKMQVQANSEAEYQRCFVS
jgi:hypothetical protein